MMVLRNQRKFVQRLFQDEKGEGYIDVLIKILITVVVGAILLKLLELAVPNLFDGIISKFESLLIV